MSALLAQIFTFDRVNINAVWQRLKRREVKISMICLIGNVKNLTLNFKKYYQDWLVDLKCLLSENKNYDKELEETIKTTNAYYNTT